MSIKMLVMKIILVVGFTDLVEIVHVELNKTPVTCRTNEE